MAKTYNPCSDQMRATSALLKFCEDHRCKSGWLDNIRQCLVALEHGDIMTACDHFRQVAFVGNGCLNDWVPPVVFAHETQEYAQDVFDGLTANWTLLMSLFASSAGIPIGPQLAEGLVILLLQIRDQERRQQAIHHIVNLPADRITSTVYEIATWTWDAGLWDEELDWFVDLLEGTDDSIIVWRFTNGSFSRFALGAGG
jgi:hypothetical protein